MIGAANSAGNAISNAANSAGNAISNAANSAGKAISNAANSAGKAVRNTGKAVRNAAGKVGKGVSKAVSGTGIASGTTVTQVNGKVIRLSNAIEAGSTLKDLSMMVHTHPTLCEVLDEAFKAGLGRAAH